MREWRFGLVHDRSCREPIAWGSTPRNRDGNAVKIQIFPHNQPKTVAIWNIYISIYVRTYDLALPPTNRSECLCMCVCELLWALWRAASHVWPVAAFSLSRLLSSADVAVRNQSQVNFSLARGTNWFSWLALSKPPTDLYNLLSLLVYYVIINWEFIWFLVAGKMRYGPRARKRCQGPGATRLILHGPHLRQKRY